eukprot:3356201-Pyramimonas_sp.AAC.1
MAAATPPTGPERERREKEREQGQGTRRRPHMCCTTCSTDSPKVSGPHAYLAFPAPGDTGHPQRATARGTRCGK